MSWRLAPQDARQHFGTAKVLVLQRGWMSLARPPPKDPCPLDPCTRGRHRRVLRLQAPVILAGAKGSWRLAPQDARHRRGASQVRRALARPVPPCPGFRGLHRWARRVTHEGLRALARPLPRGPAFRDQRRSAQGPGPRGQLGRALCVHRRGRVLARPLPYGPSHRGRHCQIKKGRRSLARPPPHGPGSRGQCRSVPSRLRATHGGWS